MGRSIRSVDDLPDAGVEEILQRARRHETRTAQTLLPSNTLVGLLFLEPSLRTRVGFEAAAVKLGAQCVTVLGQRASPTSMAERWTDTLRIMMGYIDIVVMRIDEPLESQSFPGYPPVPVLNGGDRGPKSEHPSQALIDLYEIQQVAGHPSELHIMICGDLRMRAVHSLLGLLARTPPRKLSFVTSHELHDTHVLRNNRLSARYEQFDDVDDVDVLYMAGIPHGALEEAGRARLRLTTETMARLPYHAIVLSPMPVIDEIEPDAMLDPRTRMFEQSDRGLYVRMALLEYLMLDGLPPIQ